MALRRRCSVCAKAFSYFGRVVRKFSFQFIRVAAHSVAVERVKTGYLTGAPVEKTHEQWAAFFYQQIAYYTLLHLYH